MSSSASDVVLSNTVVAVIRDVAMLQMFMHVYVIAKLRLLCSIGDIARNDPWAGLYSVL